MPAGPRPMSVLSGKDRPDAGFTMVETLVALALAMIVMTRSLFTGVNQTSYRIESIYQDTSSPTA
jgi:Tfp pilus assembly protein PilW